MKFRFGRNQDFLALLLLLLAEGPKEGKRFDALKETIGTLMWPRRSCAIKLCEAECFVTTR